MVNVQIMVLLTVVQCKNVGEYQLFLTQKCKVTSVSVSDPLTCNVIPAADKTMIIKRPTKFMTEDVVNPEIF